MSAQKQLMQFSIVMGWLRCWLSFAILRSAIMCIRGSQSFCHRPIHEEDIALEHHTVMSLEVKSHSKGMSKPKPSTLTVNDEGGKKFALFHVPVIRAYN